MYHIMITTNIYGMWYSMKNNMYTVDHVATVLGLHPKTIRRFIQEGKLKASKIGGQWRITENDLNQIMDSENIQQPMETESVNNTFSARESVVEKPASKVQVSTVVDVYVENTEEAMRISNTIIAVMNCKDPEYGYARYDHVYYKNEGKARFIFWGQPLFISNMLLMFSEIIK